MERDDNKFYFHCGAHPPVETPLDRIRQQRNDLAAVLNAIRVAVRFNNQSLREDLAALLPRMDEVLLAVEKYPL